MISNFEASQEASRGGLFETVTALAGKLFGGKAEGGAELLASLSATVHGREVTGVQRESRSER
jgi:hypothetical protein